MYIIYLFNILEVKLKIFIVLHFALLFYLSNLLVYNGILDILYFKGFNTLRVLNYFQDSVGYNLAVVVSLLGLFKYSNINRISNARHNS